MADDDRLRLARQIARSYRSENSEEIARRTRRKPRPSETDRSDKEDAELVAGFLQKIAAEHGWEDNLAATRVFTDWEAVVGPEVAKHSKVEHFESGTVHVKTSSTAWAKELKFLAPRIVARLNEILGDGQVQRIDVRGPQAPSWSAGPRSVKGRGPRDTYG